MISKSASSTPTIHPADRGTGRSVPRDLLRQKRALKRLEDSASVSGDASLSVSPKHLVRLWRGEKDAT